MTQSYLVYGVPFNKKKRVDWFPIYQLTEPGNYANNLEDFLMDLEEETFQEDLDSYQYNNDPKQLGENYLLVAHLPTDIFFIVDKNYYQYLAPDGCYQITTPDLKNYQNLVVFLNLNKIAVDFTKIGTYLLNDYSSIALEN